MKSLYEKTGYDEIINRINQLTPTAERKWGKMTVSQMLAHCCEAFKIPLGDKPLPRVVLGFFIGWMFKKKLYNDEPWKKNLPTAPNFLIKDEKDFEKEKQHLIALINEFHSKGFEGSGKYPHPFFGKLTPEQWGKSMYKHVDHHLQQFGV